MTTPSRPDANALAWERVGVEIPPLLVASAPAQLHVTLRNVGTETWDSDIYADFASYHLWSPEGALLLRDGPRTRFPRPVGPGDSVELALNFVGPPQPGVVLLEVLPVREHVRWFPEPVGDGAGLEALHIEVGDLAWDLEHELTPSSFAVDRHLLVPMRLRNTGTVTWTEGDYLSYHWLTRSHEMVAEGARTAFPQAVPPGAAVELSARLEAPPKPGDYLLRWSPVREQVRWFDRAPDHANDEVPVTVSPPELAWRLVKIDNLPPIWVNRRAWVHVTVQNTGSVPWSDASGDHLSYHWLDRNDLPVNFDGRRTRFSDTIEPGETATVSALIWGPRVAGAYKLQWEMVREHVKWHGPPTSGPRTLLVEVRRLSSLLQLGLAALTLIGAVLLRLSARTLGRHCWLQSVPILWAWSACVLVVVTFSELSGVEMWRSSLRYSMSGATVAVLPLFALGGRVRVWAACAAITATNLLAFSDLIYMHFFGAIVPVAALTAAHQASELGASVAGLTESAYAWLIPTPASAWIAALLWPRTTNLHEAITPTAPTTPTTPTTPATTSTWRISRWALPALCLLGSYPFLDRLHRAMTDKLGRRVYSEAHNVSRLGVLNAHLFDLTRSLREALERGELDRTTLDEVATFYGTRAKQATAQAARLPDFGLARGANLLLIQVEAAQSWIVGATLNGQVITPFLNDLHREGLAFPNIFDQTHHGKTSDSEYITLSSNHALKVGALAFLRASNHFVTLAHVLKREGYSTLSAHPYKRGFWNRAVLHPRYGFDQSMFRRELGPGQLVGWGLADGIFFSRALSELKAVQQPFFAFLITLSLHHPYDTFPDNLKQLELGKLEGTNLGNYLHGMHYFDRSLAEFFAQLRDAHLLGNTIVALYGDHDARLPFNAKLLELMRVKRWSPSLEHRFDRVPLFIVLPGSTRSGRVPTIGGQIDIAPTLLHYLGLPRPRSYLGRPLLGNLVPPVAAHPDGSAFTTDRMYISRGRDIPHTGGCFTFPAGTTRAAGDCTELRRKARLELRHSRTVLDNDLQRWLEPLRLPLP
ncbi:MAG: sulfatase-like hydrolase/transferase [Nannocystaceae bacterium]